MIFLIAKMSEEGREIFKRAKEAHAAMSVKLDINQYQSILQEVKNCMSQGEVRRQKLSPEVRMWLLKDGFSISACIDNENGNYYLISWKTT